MRIDHSHSNTITRGTSGQKRRSARGALVPSTMLGASAPRRVAGLGIVALSFGAMLVPKPAEAQFVCGAAGTYAVSGGFVTVSGQGADASGAAQNLACGNGAYAAGTGSSAANSAFGRSTNAGGTDGRNSAIGAFSNANGDNSINTAIGYQSGASGATPHGRGEPQPSECAGSEHGFVVREHGRAGDRHRRGRGRGLLLDETGGRFRLRRWGSKRARRARARWGKLRR